MKVPSVVLIILNLESVSLVRMTTQTVENAGHFALQIVRKEESANYLATIIIAIAYVDFLSTLFHNIIN